MSFIDKAKEGTSNVTSYFLGIILIFVVYILGSYLLILDLQWNFGIESFDGISQKEIVIQNIQRQKYIDQSISLNLMIHPNCPAKQVSELLIYGWENGIKTFYYQRSANPAQELARNIMNCTSCEA